MKNIQARPAPRKTAKPKRPSPDTALLAAPDAETKSIEEEAEPFGANFA